MKLSETKTLSQAPGVEAMLTDPNGALLMLLRGPLADVSSGEVAKATGVPASTLRSFKGRSSKGLKADTWGRLMLWALQEAHRRAEA